MRLILVVGQPCTGRSTYVQSLVRTSPEPFTVVDGAALSDLSLHLRHKRVWRALFPNTPSVAAVCSGGAGGPALTSSTPYGTSPASSTAPEEAALAALLAGGRSVIIDGGFERSAHRRALFVFMRDELARVGGRVPDGPSAAAAEHSPRPGPSSQHRSRGLAMSQSPASALWLVDPALIETRVVVLDVRGGSVEGAEARQQCLGYRCASEAIAAATTSTTAVFSSAAPHHQPPQAPDGQSPTEAVSVSVPKGWAVVDRASAAEGPSHWENLSLPAFLRDVAMTAIAEEAVYLPLPPPHCLLLYPSAPRCAALLVPLSALLTFVTSRRKGAAGSADGERKGPVNDKAATVALRAAVHLPLFTRLWEWATGGVDNRRLVVVTGAPTATIAPTSGGGESTLLGSHASSVAMPPAQAVVPLLQSLRAPFPFIFFSTIFADEDVGKGPDSSESPQVMKPLDAAGLAFLERGFQLDIRQTCLLAANSSDGPATAGEHPLRIARAQPLARVLAEGVRCGGWCEPQQSSSSAPAQWVDWAANPLLFSNRKEPLAQAAVRRMPFGPHTAALLALLADNLEHLCPRHGHTAPSALGKAAIPDATAPQADPTVGFSFGSSSDGTQAPRGRLSAAGTGVLSASSPSSGPSQPQRYLLSCGALANLFSDAIRANGRQYADAGQVPLEGVAILEGLREPLRPALDARAWRPDEPARPTAAAVAAQCWNSDRSNQHACTLLLARGSVCAASCTCGTVVTAAGGNLCRHVCAIATVLADTPVDAITAARERAAELEQQAAVAEVVAYPPRADGPSAAQQSTYVVPAGPVNIVNGMPAHFAGGSTTTRRGAAGRALALDSGGISALQPTRPPSDRRLAFCGGPNAPKRPLTPYFYFLQQSGARRTALLQEGRAIADVTRALAAEYNALGDDGKAALRAGCAQFNDAAQAAWTVYRETPEYRAAREDAIARATAAAKRPRSTSPGATHATATAAPVGVCGESSADDDERSVPRAPDQNLDAGFEQRHEEWHRGPDGAWVCDWDRAQTEADLPAPAHNGESPARSSKKQARRPLVLGSFMGPEASAVTAYPTAATTDMLDPRDSSALARRSTMKGMGSGPSAKPSDAT